MVNVFEAVESNKRKSTIIVVLFAACIAVIVYFLAIALNYNLGIDQSPLSLMGMALVVSGLSSFASYYYSDKIVLGISGAKPATRSGHFVFYSATENLSLAAGVPMPKLYIIEDTAMNAFATGRDPEHAAICATTGLLSRLTRSELEGVIAHELAHVGNYDIRLMSIVTVMVGMVTLLADWLIRSSWSGGRRRDDSGGNLFVGIGVALSLLAPLFAQLIQLAISRRREFLADATSAKLTRQPSALASALAKLGADTEPLEAANKATAHMYIVNPLINHHDALGWFSSLFQTHPPISDRIKALQKMS
jgi:heat shock protein HtpX